MKKIMRIEDYVKENREVINDLRIASALLEKRRPIIAESLMDLAERLDDLAESEDEDERIIRILKEGLEGLTVFNHTPVDKILAWLEKQKEPHFTKRNALFDKCVENCDPEVMKEVSDKVDSMLEKEQKPAEYLDKDMVYAIMTKLTNLSYSTLIPINSDEYKKLHEITFDVRSLLDYPISSVQKHPAEWSEEDEDMLNSCVSSIEEAKENRYAYKETDGDTSYDHEIAWLKLLRNRVGKEFLQPHWKPSEEQMRALLKVVDKARELHYSSNSGYDEYDVLRLLYKQLKEL